MKEAEPRSVDCRYCGRTWTPTRVMWNSYSCFRCGERVHDIQRKASLIVRKAVIKGLLPHVKTLLCVDCGAQATEWEHRDYTKPLDVEPTCRRCNRLRGPGFIPGMTSPPQAYQKIPESVLIHVTPRA